jgi:hypothetical protein
MVGKIATWVGTVASVASFVQTIAANSSDYWILITFGCFFILGLGVVLEIVSYMRRRPKIYRDDKKIRDYLYRWIKGGGRVVIFTHDMTWAADQEMQDLLISKSRVNELTICLPHAIALTDLLQKGGASIITYENLDYVPTSRFTIIQDGRNDSQVAVGRRINGRHIIEEYVAGAHPVFAIAKDLVEILRRSAR